LGQEWLSCRTGFIIGATLPFGVAQAIGLAWLRRPVAASAMTLLSLPLDRAWIEISSSDGAGWACGRQPAQSQIGRRLDVRVRSPDQNGAVLEDRRDELHRDPQRARKPSRARRLVGTRGWLRRRVAMGSLPRQAALPPEQRSPRPTLDRLPCPILGRKPALAPSGQQQRAAGPVHAAAVSWVGRCQSPGEVSCMGEETLTSARMRGPVRRRHSFERRGHQETRTQTLSTPQGTLPPCRPGTVSIASTRSVITQPNE